MTVPHVQPPGGWRPQAPTPGQAQAGGSSGQGHRTLASLERSDQNQMEWSPWVQGTERGSHRLEPHDGALRLPPPPPPPPRLRLLLFLFPLHAGASETGVTSASGQAGRQAGGAELPEGGAALPVRPSGLPGAAAPPPPPWFPPGGDPGAGSHVPLGRDGGECCCWQRRGRRQHWG